MRRRLPMILGVLVGLAAPLGAAGAPGSSRGDEPPGAMFKHGFNLCKTASLAAVQKAAGAPSLAAGSFDGLGCTWSSNDGKYVVMLSTHPAAYIAVLELLRNQNGKHGEKVYPAVLHAAYSAYMDVHPFAQTHRYAKDLFAVYYPRAHRNTALGVVQLSMNYGTPLPDSTLVAVMRLVTHT